MLKSLEMAKQQRLVARGLPDDVNAEFACDVFRHFAPWRIIVDLIGVQQDRLKGELDSASLTTFNLLSRTVH